MKILVTGAAGFIGAAVCQSLLQLQHQVIGIDNLNNYYAVTLKQARLQRLQSQSEFHFQRLDITNSSALFSLFATNQPQRIIHLAAQAGVRYSFENPQAYIDSNIGGFTNILEASRQHNIEHLVYASSSSVYGANTKLPFAESDRADQPVSLYGATKKANEALAYSYSHLYGIPTTGLRFFTVYGPWGRPDMAPIKFAKRILAREPIDIYNNGQHKRDFTYIDDIVAGTIRVLQQLPEDSTPPHKIYNIGNGSPVDLMQFIELLEENLGCKAIKNFLEKQPGDVDATWADTTALEQAVGYKPRVSIEEGISNFVAWYKSYYQTDS